MKKNLFVLILALIGMTTAMATDFAYITGKSVNFRATPSTSGSKISALTFGEVVEYVDTKGDWIKVRVKIWDNRTMTQKIHTGYVSAAYVTRIISSPIPKAVLGSDFELMASDGDVAGYLSFEWSGNTLEYFYRIVSNEMRRAGGSGTLDAGNGDVVYAAESLAPVNGDPSIYDAAQGLLYFNGILWKVST